MIDGDLYVRKEAATQQASRAQEGHLTVLASSNSAETMTIRCRLDGAPPKGHKWSQAATDAFRELVGENEIVSLRVIREEADCPFVELNLPDSNDGSINFDLSTEFDIFPLDSCDVIKQEVNNNICGELEKTETDSLINHDEMSLKNLLPVKIPQVGEKLQLTVSYAVSPDNFVIIAHSDEGEVLDQLTQSMSDYYNSNDQSTSISMSSLEKAGSQSYAAAKLNDKEWHRVEILQIIPNGSSALVVVRYVDQGSQAMLDSSQLRNLAPQFRSTPCQAVPAALAGVAHVEGNWSPENNYWFNNRVAGKRLQGTVVDTQSGKAVLELWDEDQEISIHQQLMQEGNKEKRIL